MNEVKINTSKIKSVINNYNIAESQIVWLIISVLSFFVVWEILILFTSLSLFIPSPLEVLGLLYKHLYIPIGEDTIIGHIFVSLRRIFIAYSLALISGVIVGLYMGWSKMFEAFVKPVFDILRPIPPIAWIPLAILWFGIAETSKIFLVFIGVFAPIVLNTYSGVKQTDLVLVKALKMLGARENQVFKNVIFPNSIPAIFAGMQIALSSAMMVILAAEMIRSTKGLGWVIIMGMNSGNTTQIIVGMIVIGIVGYLLATIMRALEKNICAWSRELEQ